MSYAFSGGKGIPSRSWPVMGVAALVMIGFYGTTVSFSVFLKPLIGEFGWTRAAISGSMSTLVGTAGLVGIIMGPLVDRYGVRIFIALGALIGGSGYLLMSHVSSLWQLYVFFGVMMGICQASCWVPITATISKRFGEMRVLALGISTSGITAGQMILPPLTAYLIAAQGWRLAYTILAIIVLLTAIPAIIVLGRNPAERKSIPGEIKQSEYPGGDAVGDPVQSEDWSIWEAVKTVQFWMLMVTGFVIAAGYYFIITHIVAYATDLGIAPTSAAIILTSLGGGSVLGKLTVWSIFTRVGSRYTLFFLLLIKAVALFLLMHATGLWMLFALGAMFGFGFGATAPIRTAMIPEFFGLKAVGTIIGLSNGAYSIGGLAAPVLAGHIFDRSRSYDTAFLAGVLLLIAGMAATYFLKAPVKRV